MSKYPFISIPEIVWFQEGPGVRNAQYKDSGIKLLNVANLQDGQIDLSNSERYISEEEAYGRYKHFLVDDGDFIIASSGIKVEYFDKKMGFANKFHLPLCMNTSTIRFKPIDKTKINMRYFMYSLKTNSFKEQLRKQITGSAQLNFGPSHLKKMRVPLAPLPEQERIASELDAVSGILLKQKEQEKLLNELIKSKFHEMFGDPVLNDKGWKLISWENLFNTTTGKLDANAMRKDGKYPFFTCSKDIYRINIYAFDCEALLLAGNNAAGIYDVKYYKGKFNAYQRTYVITLKNLNNMYLPYKIMLEKKLNKMKRLSIGTNTKYLTMPILKSFSFFVLPLPLQQQFADYVNQVEESKEKLKAEMEQTETLYRALMQKYFGE